MFIWFLAALVGHLVGGMIELIATITRPEHFPAPFDGDHGWFWRNRDSTPIDMTIQVRGDYSAIVETY